MATRSHTAPRRSRLSPSFGRALPWLAGTVLAAGIALFVARVVVHDKPGVQATAPPANAPAAAVPKKEPSIKLPASARATAQRFIETAVLRQNLAESYALTDPELRQGYTLKQWETGDIPVVPFTKKYFLQARMKLDYAHPADALLEVAMLSTNDDAFKSQYFFLELKERGGVWRVSSWVPRASPKIPISPA
jgi:hypothetical protein